MAVLTLASIGSAWFYRVASLLASRSASFLDNSCFYGHVFSTAEAVQMVAHGVGAADIPQALAPLVTGPEGFVNEPVFDLTQDRIFVEISTRKVYTLDGVHLNPMLLRRFFTGFPKLMETAFRAWPDAAARAAHLRALAADPEMQGATDDELWILRNIQVAVRDDDQMTLDFRRLHAMLGNRMVIVTPPNLRNIGEGANDRFIRLQRRLGQQLNIPFLDSGALAAQAWRNFAGGGGEAEFQSHFELALANQLIATFIEPAKRLLAMTMDSRDLDSPRRRLRFRRRKAPPRLAEPPPALDPEAFRHAAGSAAWTARWADVHGAVTVAMEAGDTDVETARLGFRAAWYSDRIEAALDCFESQLAAGQALPAELLEGAEVAFQAGRPAAALAWIMQAVRAAPALAEPALKLIQIHGHEASSRELLELAAACGEPVADLIQSLERDSAVRREIAQDMLSRWSGEPVAANAEALLILALRGYDPQADVARARDIANWCERFTCAEQARPLTARALARALNAALAAADPREMPELAEQLATELAGLEPNNARAVTHLAQLRDAEGRYKEAAGLLDGLAHYHLGSVAIQARCVEQWLKAGELARACAILRDAEAAHPQNPALERVRGRVMSAIKRQLETVSTDERQQLETLLLS